MADLLRSIVVWVKAVEFFGSFANATGFLKSRVHFQVDELPFDPYVGHERVFAPYEVDPGAPRSVVVRASLILVVMCRRRFDQIIDRVVKRVAVVMIQPAQRLGAVEMFPDKSGTVVGHVVDIHSTASITDAPYLLAGAPGVDAGSGTRRFKMCLGSNVPDSGPGSRVVRKTFVKIFLSWCGFTCYGGLGHRMVSSVRVIKNWSGVCAPDRFLQGRGYLGGPQHFYATGGVL